MLNAPIFSENEAGTNFIEVNNMRPDKPPFRIEVSPPQPPFTGKMLRDLPPLPTSLEEELSLLGDRAPNLQKTINKLLMCHRGDATESAIQDVLITTVRDGDEEEKEGAATLLPWCGWNLEHLFEFASHHNLYIRRAGFEGLASRSLNGKAAALPVLKKGMKDDDRDIIFSAFHAWQSLGVDLASEGVPFLGECLDERDPEARGFALKLLAWLESEAIEVVPAVVNAMLEDAEEHIRQEAVTALLAIDPNFQSAEKYLLETVNDEAQGNTLSALRAIGEAVRPLRHRLQLEWRKKKTGQDELGKEKNRSDVKDRLNDTEDEIPLKDGNKTGSPLATDAESKDGNAAVTGQGQNVPPSDPITFDQGNRTVTIHGIIYPISDFRAYRLFKLVAQAEGDVVSRQTIVENIKVKGKNTITNIRKKLPTPLQICLETNRGREGGYRFRCPEKK